ncbi:type II toxin-antitoxin system Phd/YefM family antitoxin [Psychrobacter namhaensis]|jgi:antitoxin YefM|uniref:type II toxin-antitoxin system Phd/YefM family antitoxin n=1 Tax=Psychrobacter namhaensis TaxID=292734 RepID=UPI003FD27307
MKSISFSEANKDLEAALNTVNYHDDPIVVGRQNDNDAVIMSLAHYNGLIETLYLLKSSDNANHLAISIEQYRAGQVTVRDLNDNILY